MSPRMRDKINNTVGKVVLGTLGLGHLCKRGILMYTLVAVSYLCSEHSKKLNKSETYYKITSQLEAKRHKS